MYDNQIGRWHVIDDKSEKYLNSSPHNYVDNNPISRKDVNGHDWIVTISDTKTSYGKIIRNVDIKLKAQVLNSTGNTKLNTQEFANAIKDRFKKLLQVCLVKLELKYNQEFLFHHQQLWYLAL